MRKLVAAGLAAALSLSIAPVASAQLSSLGSLSSSSTSSPATPKTEEEKRKQNAEDLGAAFESVLEQSGAARLEAHDEVAEAALEDARNGEVLWITDPEQGLDDRLYAAERFENGNHQVFLRVAHADVQQALDSLAAAAPEHLGVEYPYGLAVGADEDWAYLALTTPIFL